MSVCARVFGMHVLMTKYLAQNRKSKRKKWRIRIGILEDTRGSFRPPSLCSVQFQTCMQFEFAFYYNILCSFCECCSVQVWLSLSLPLFLCALVYSFLIISLTHWVCTLPCRHNEFMALQNNKMFSNVRTEQSNQRGRNIYCMQYEWMCAYTAENRKEKK